MFKFVILLIIVLLASCGSSDTTTNDAKEEVAVCSCPSCTIYLQPYGDFSEEEATKLVNVLKTNFNKFLDGYWTFKVLPARELPKQAFVDGYNKYEALAILKDLKTHFNPHNDEVYIGLTHKDICKDIHGYEHYGIVGLSYMPGTVCVVSDRRLSDKSMVWKPVLHEFMHAFYGAKHCPNDDRHCFMVDAKGHGNFGVQNTLCDSCRR